MSLNTKYLLCLISIAILLNVRAQDPQRFEEDVMSIQMKYDTLWDSSRETLVFTGSSSIRLWENLQDRFPSYQIINTGFGGSESTDLLAFLDELVLQYKPSTVFIYEGDNDIERKKKPAEILRVTGEIVSRIKQEESTNSIVIISAKPSISRWHLRRKYRRLNRKFKKMCEKDPVMEFANIWDPMLENKKLKKDLFIEDGLHLNEKGYDIWYDVIKEFTP